MTTQHTKTETAQLWRTCSATVQRPGFSFELFGTFTARPGETDDQIRQKITEQCGSKWGFKANELALTFQD
jgi:hypothetical protein